MWLTGPAAPRHVGSSQTRARTRVPCIGRQTLNHCATREAPFLHLKLEKWHPLPLLSCHLQNIKLNLGSMTQFASTLYNHIIRAFVSNSQICQLLIQRENTHYFKLLPCCRELHKTVVKDTNTVVAIW